MAAEHRRHRDGDEAAAPARRRAGGKRRAAAGSSARPLRPASPRRAARCRGRAPRAGGRGGRRRSGATPRAPAAGGRDRRTLGGSSGGRCSNSITISRREIGSSSEVGSSSLETAKSFCFRPVVRSSVGSAPSRSAGSAAAERLSIDGGGVAGEDSGPFPSMESLLLFLSFLCLCFEQKGLVAPGVARRSPRAHPRGARQRPAQLARGRGVGEAASASGVVGRRPRRLGGRGGGHRARAVAAARGSS